jgi:transcriptional adapter 3
MAGPSSSKAKNKPTAKDRQSRSRNTTPVSSTSASIPVDVKNETSRRTVERSVSPYFTTSFSHPPRLTHKWSNTPLADLFDEHTQGSPSTIPSAKSLNAIWNEIESHFYPAFKEREDKSHELMSETANKLKERTERDHQRNFEKARRDAEEKRQQQQQQQQKKKNVTPKKRDREEIRPPVVGSHGVARQDGKDTNRGIIKKMTHPLRSL